MVDEIPVDAVIAENKRTLVHYIFPVEHIYRKFEMIEKKIKSVSFNNVLITSPGATWPNWKFRGTLEGAAPYYTI